MRKFTVFQIVSLFVGWCGPLALAGGILDKSVTCIDWVTEPSLEELAAIPLKPLNPGIISHPIERRGFVPVPLDYSRPAGPKLQIFFRFIPVIDGSVDDASKPVVVVINGGPGAPSSHYRKYDFDYSGKTPAKADYLGELTKYFRVLIIDQRGTAGNSSALDVNNPNVRPEIIARYFDSRHIALDHQAVINAVLPSGNFAMIAQSFGGFVGMHYMSLPQITRLPSHLCFSSAGVPHSDALMVMQARRNKQKELNEHLGQGFSSVVGKIYDVRAHFEMHELSPDNVNFLWRFLGQGENGVWEKKLEAELDLLLTKDRAGLKAWIAEEGDSNFLNYVLSSPILTPGYTDATVARKTSELIPYAHRWMLDENWMLQQVGRDGSWQQSMLDRMDAFPPPPVYFAPVPEIRQGLARSRILFSLALGDVYLPLEVVRASASPYYMEGVSEEIVLPGGHKAIFLPQGARAFLDWTQR